MRSVPVTETMASFQFVFMLRVTFTHWLPHGNFVVWYFQQSSILTHNQTHIQILLAKEMSAFTEKKWIDLFWNCNIIIALYFIAVWVHTCAWQKSRRQTEWTHKKNEKETNQTKNVPAHTNKMNKKKITHVQDLSRMNSLFISLNGFSFTVNGFDVIYLRQTNKRNR